MALLSIFNLSPIASRQIRPPRQFGGGITPIRTTEQQAQFRFDQVQM
jgi:hypothetical protein